MRNEEISRTDIGSATPFDFLRNSEEGEDTLNIDSPIESEELKDVDSTPIEEKIQNPPKPLEEEEDISPTNTGEEDDSEEEEEEEEVPSNAKVSIKTNIPKLLAERLKADNQLPEDFEVTDDTTSADVEKAYRSFLIDKVKEEEKYEALQELRSEYGDEEVLETAKKLHYGIPEQEIKVEQAYSALGSLQLDSSEDNYEELAKTLFQQYYLDKGLSPKEAEVNAVRDFDDAEDIDTLIETRKSYFSERAINISEQHKEEIRVAKELDKKRKSDNIKKINKYLDEAVVDGVKYSKEEMEQVRKALFEKSETITNDKGQRIRVTPYYKKKYERAKNEETALKDIIDFVLGYDSAKVTDKARKSARKKLVDDLNDMIEVNVELDNPKPNLRTPSSTEEVIERKALN